MEAKAHGIQRILVIDDNEDLADTLVMALNGPRSVARAAYNGNSGLDAVKDFKPEVILLDLGMPKMDGYETARRIRALPEGNGVKLIAHTAWSKEQVEDRTQAAGFDGHITKPASYVALCSALWCKENCAETAQTCPLLAEKLAGLWKEPT